MRRDRGRAANPAAVPGGRAAGERDPLLEPEGLDRGRISLYVSAADLARLGPVRGAKTQLTVTRTGTDTDHWRVYSVG